MSHIHYFLRLQDLSRVPAHSQLRSLRLHRLQFIIQPTPNSSCSECSTNYMGVKGCVKVTARGRDIITITLYWCQNAFLSPYRWNCVVFQTLLCSSCSFTSPHRHVAHISLSSVCVPLSVGLFIISNSNSTFMCSSGILTRTRWHNSTFRISLKITKS